MNACRIRQGTRVHFVGVGGVGMCGLAEILLHLGYPVSGSDLRESETTRRLAQLGAAIRAGHAAENLELFDEPADVVVVSTAVPKDNPELVTAKLRGIPVIARAELLAELMRLKIGIAVAGSHGKTTTTSLIASVLAKAGLDPTAVIGGRLPELGSGARLGASEYLVAEADESDGSFLHLSPTVAVVTNIDPEHLDHYGDMDHLRAAFVDFVNKLPFYGRAVLCADHPEIRALFPRISKRYVTYGLTAGEYGAADLSFSGLRSRFVALHNGKPLGEVEVAMPGAHNVQNALAVLAVCESVGVPFATFQQAMASFQGTLRRFTIRGELALPDGPVTLVDDYGHHPVEIRATLAAARRGFPGRRIVVAFQPHRYTRTRDLFAEFSQAFDDADRIVLLGIYAAGEAPIPGVTTAALAKALSERLGERVSYIEKRAELAQTLLPELRGNDLVITLGAGDITHAADELLRLAT